MRAAHVWVDDRLAGTFTEVVPQKQYQFEYVNGYTGAPISLTMPISSRTYQFDHFPTFFEGLLPEGPMLEGMLRILKLDANDLFGQLMAVGGDMVGNVTVKPVEHE